MQEQVPLPWALICCCMQVPSRRLHARVLPRCPHTHAYGWHAKTHNGTVTHACARGAHACPRYAESTSPASGSAASVASIWEGEGGALSHKYATRVK